MAIPRRSERTLAREAGVSGISFLAGLDVTLRFLPAEPGSGLRFIRTDLPDRPEIPARVQFVVPRQRRTAIQNGSAVVEMVEHVLAALAGLQVDNARIEIDGPETPGCDGSSRAFVAAIESAGIVEQGRRRDLYVIDRPVSVARNGSSLTAHPSESDRLIFSYNLDYPNTSIGRQSRFVEITPETFRNELADCRTFVLKAEADALRQAGIGLRTKESDLLVFGPDGPIENTLRFPDECVRHKLLDMVGDFALLGKDLVGHVLAHRSGHQLNAELVRALIEAEEGRGKPPVLDIAGIMRFLPHRYPFLLIDRVESFESGRQVVALKNVTCNEPFFNGHWPGRPVMPGVLILEALAQAAGVLVAQTESRNQEAMLVAIDEARIRRPVVPGDQLRLEAEVLRSKMRLVEVRGIARVDGQIAAEASIRFALRDAPPSV